MACGFAEQSSYGPPLVASSSAVLHGSRAVSALTDASRGRFLIDDHSTAMLPLAKRQTPNCWPLFSTTSVSTMVPTPLITGTVIYAIIGAALCALTFGALVTGKLSKDNAA